jgi:L-ascorbate metabolism protein UlaG (beta-lactamase superfamily)
MPRLLLALLTLSLLAFGATSGQEKGKDKEKDKVPEKVKDADKVVLSWWGQSFFLIRTPKGTRVLIDPHEILNYPRIQNLKVDLALMSHNHNDHTQLGIIENFKKKDPKEPLEIIPGLVKKGKRDDWNRVNQTFKDVKIRTVGVYHDGSEGLQYGKNTVFILEIDGWRIAHLGDLGHLLTPEQLAEIKKDGPIDVLMIPVGGIYSLNGREAKKVVKQIEPKEYVIPMHYGTVVFDDLLPVTEFLEGQPKENILRLDITKKTNRLVLDRNDKRPRPQITVLHWFPGN